MSRERKENSPIIKKADAIFKQVEALINAIPEDDDFLQSQAGLIMSDSMMICAKLAGASGVGLYSIKMQNAAIIRKCAMDLYVFVGGLRYREGFTSNDSVELIRKEIEEFRLLFIEWVANFDKSDYIWDDWELFNPPGAIPPSDDDYNDPINWDDFDFDS